MNINIWNVYTSRSSVGGFYFHVGEGSVMNISMWQEYTDHAHISTSEWFLVFLKA